MLCLVDSRGTILSYLQEVVNWDTLFQFVQTYPGYSIRYID